VGAKQASEAARRQEATFRAYVETGSVKGAAHRLGLSERRVRQLLDEYVEANNHGTLVHAVFRFGNPQRDAEM
jgi:molybdenum-dependent DNA-binding transcriptional regulator ModE